MFLLDVGISFLLLFNKLHAFFLRSTILAVIIVVMKFQFCFSCSHSFFSFAIGEKDGQFSVPIL